MSLVERAAAFADRAHCGQMRRYTNERYIVHPAAVAHILEEHGADEATVAAGYLHDVIEDTPTTYLDLVNEFGHEVAVLVSEVTDVSTKADGNRAKRKVLDLAHLACASPRAQNIKLADLIDNTKTVAVYDPGFALTWFKEKADIISVMTAGDVRLRKMALEVMAMQRPVKGSLDWYGIYVPNVIKMANGKVQMCKGRKQNELLARIEQVKRLDAAVMGFKPDTGDPAWCVAADEACGAAWALLDFAGPI